MGAQVYKDLLEQGAKRHEKLFPKADLASQVLKLEEELQELAEAPTIDKMVNELADCLICCQGIYRFAPRVADLIVHDAFEDSHWKPTGLLAKAIEYVEKKWIINESREWIFDEVTKKYKHKGKDGHE